MRDIIPTLRKRNIIEILLELKKADGALDKNTLNFRIIGDRQPRQSIYGGCDHLEEVGFVDVNKKSEPNKHYVTLTEKGKFIAKRLEYLFDEEKEFYPISRKNVKSLENIAKQRGITWQELVSEAIQKYIITDLEIRRNI